MDKEEQREAAQSADEAPNVARGAVAGSGLVLLTLATGQFLMTLDTSVMNVSIATVAEDVGTSITGIQSAITLYTLVMATCMILGGKIGSLIGHRRAFSIGCVVYGAGSLTTSLAPNLTVLLIGWSLLEGLGAALIMPAIIALVAGNVAPAGRRAAYGLIAASSAIAVAVGPLIGGLCTTYFSWRWVFAGEVIIVVVILALARRVHDTPPERRAAIDYVGAVLTAAGLGLAVFGILRSSDWGWVQPKTDAPSFLGLSPTVWCLLAGAGFLALLFAWEGRREERGEEPLVRPGMLRNVQLRAGLLLFFFQYAVQAGMFFVIPLFLSVALGLTAVATGARLLPLSAALLVAAVGVPRFFPHASPRAFIRLGVVVMALATVVLVAALDVGAGPEITTVPLLLAGLGMGAMASQLGSVTVSSVSEEESGEVGGVQNTATNLGASVGTALVGSILIAALTAAAIQGVQEQPGMPAEVKEQAAVEMSGGIQFISDAQLETALDEAGVDEALASDLLEVNREARIAGLRLALSVVALLALVGLFFSGPLPTKPPGSPSG